MNLLDHPPQPLAPRTNLTGSLIDRLKEEIVEGRLAPRTRLPTEHALMAAFGISRTVVREAIAVLRAEGLVETRQGSGAFVAADPGRRPFRIEPDGLRSIAQVLDVMELRICVEVEAAGLAAERASKAEIARIARCDRAFTRAVAAGDLAIDLDYEFHAIIGAATGNPYFSSFLDFIGRLIIPRRTIHLDPNDPARRNAYMERIGAQHHAIAEAIAAGNVEKARRAMRTHLVGSRDHYRQLADTAATKKARPLQPRLQFAKRQPIRPSPSGASRRPR